MVTDRLVELLASKDRKVRQHAAASLVEIGRTVPASPLLLRLIKTQSEAVRDELIEILTRIALALPTAEDVQLKMELLTAVAMVASSPFRPRLSRKNRPETT